MIIIFLRTTESTPAAITAYTKEQFLVAPALFKFEVAVGLSLAAFCALHRFHAVRFALLNFFQYMIHLAYRQIGFLRFTG
jgi:hypothetical protein